ncbi:mitochondrial hydrolase YKR070W isoform X2 [Lycium barbarum]|uniref:mitochondrial hydrolase YKR070W isoform X2 n=1 Tax=Lycium barbarum TaxID=112863 RepID=UPI00293E6DC9|nr:mitochondrial hydrolase YKR070W isoform X2 [Lycium barbarum]
MRILQILTRKLSSTFSYRQLHSSSNPASFGIAFDIDGVLLRGSNPIGASPRALKRLYDHAGILKVPYVFLTNGGGVPESKRAKELGGLLDVNILPLQVIQGHTPFKQLMRRNVLSIDEYASCFDNIDPLAQYKKWTDKQDVNQNNKSKHIALSNDPCLQRVQAVFVVSDSVDWSRDIQVLCDILRTGGLPGKEIAHQPPLFFANDDLAYQALFPSERLGMGAFRIALESVFNAVHPAVLKYTSYGKPNPFVFNNAETVLMQVLQSCHNNHQVDGRKQHFKTLYMIGDNPSVDIKGARQAGIPWFSILTRTGVFKGKENHDDFPADLVVDTVEEAVDYILNKECIS